MVTPNLDIKRFFPFDADVVSACACSDGAARFDVDGEEFVGQFRGSISVRIAQPAVDPPGRVTIPLHIVGYSTQSDVPGLGATSLDFDFSRPVPPSTLRGDAQRGFFPAVQTMNLNILMTSDAFPGRTLRSASRGTLVNTAAQAFPPPEGSTYVLQRPVELVDAEKPGKILARLNTVNTTILSTNVGASEITVGSGVRLFTAQTRNFAGAGNHVEFQIPRRAKATVALFDARGKRVRTLLEEELKEGRHSVALDPGKLRGSRYFYQLFLDGVPATARMLVVNRS